MRILSGVCFCLLGSALLVMKSTGAQSNMDGVPGPNPMQVPDKKVSENPYKWSQHPDLEASGVAVVCDEIQLADDFLCTLSGPITHISVWAAASKIGDPAMEFTLALYSDIPSGIDNPYSHPGKMLWTRKFPAGTFNAVPVEHPGTGWRHDPSPDTWQVQNGLHLFRFDFTIPRSAAYRQTEGAIYWLGVTCIPPAGAALELGWQTSLDHWRANAVWLEGSPPTASWREFLHDVSQSMSPEFMNMAFAISGTEEAQALDFGDAPDRPYPTRLAYDGARHVVAKNVYMGSSIDAELDGQTSITATGDNTAGANDEDGVDFISLYVGHPITLDVTCSVDGFLWGWIDFDRNGSWAEEPDLVLSSTVMTAGVNRLTFPMPAGTATGETFARFRFVTRPDVLGYSGSAPNGEVEDYRIVIRDISEADEVNAAGKTSGISSEWLTGSQVTSMKPGFKVFLRHPVPVAGDLLWMRLTWVERVSPSAESANEDD